MNRSAAFFWTLVAVGTAMAMPDVNFRKPEAPVSMEEALHVPEASDSARAFISAEAELAQSRIARDGTTTVPLMITIKAPEGTALRRPPTDFVAVFDRSGSMSGEDRIGFARKGLLEAAKLMRPDDRISILTFSDYVERLTPLDAVTDNGASIALLTRSIKADGQTFLSSALYEAARILRSESGEGRGKQILLLSDGKANVGLAGEELARLGESLGQEGIIITAMGVGVDYDAATFIKLGEGSGGGYAYVTQGERIPAAIRGEIGRGENRFIDDMRLSLDLPPGVEFQTAYKYRTQMRGRRVQIFAPTLSAGEVKTIIVDLAVTPERMKFNKATGLTIAQIGIEYDRLRYTEPRKAGPDGAPQSGGRSVPANGGTEATDRPVSMDHGELSTKRESLSMTVAARTTGDARLAEASQSVNIFAEREALRADLAWAATSPDVTAGRYDEAAANLRQQAAMLQAKNQVYKSPSVASRISSMLETALEIETRNFFGGSAVSVSTMGQNQAALSGGCY